MAMATSGNAQLGIFRGGQYVPVIDIYNYLTDTIVTGSAANSGGFSSAGAGNTEVGVFNGGTSIANSIISNDVYTYTTSTTISDNALSAAISAHAGTSSTPGGF